MIHIVSMRAARLLLLVLLLVAGSSGHADPAPRKGEASPSKSVGETPGAVESQPTVQPQQPPTTDAVEVPTLMGPQHFQILSEAAGKALTGISQLQTDLAGLQAAVSYRAARGDVRDLVLAGVALVLICLLIIAIALLLTVRIAAGRRPADIQALLGIRSDIEALRRAVLGAASMQETSRPAGDQPDQIYRLSLAIMQEVQSLPQIQPGLIAQHIRPEFRRLQEQVAALSAQVGEIAKTMSARSARPDQPMPELWSRETQGKHAIAPQRYGEPAPEITAPASPADMRPPASSGGMEPTPPVPDGLVEDYNLVLSDNALMGEFTQRYGAVWATRSGGSFLADNREPSPTQADGFLFIRARGYGSATRSAPGLLVPGLNFFHARSALNDPLTLQRVFEGVFKVQQTSQDRLIAPASARLSDVHLTVVQEGVLQFAR